MTKYILTFLFAITMASPAYAQDMMSDEEVADYIVFGFGQYDLFEDDEAIDLRVEYRPAIPLIWDNVRPWIGAEVTTDFSIWGGGGVLYDWMAAPSFHVIPSVGVGAYAQGSSDLDLGNTIEIRTQIEAAYQFPNKDRFGLALSHLSNSDLSDQNPGTQVFNLYYHRGF